MVELTFITGEKQKTDTIAADIGTAGIHIFTDKGFFDRKEDISEYFSNYLTDEDITVKGLSEVRQKVLKRAMKAANYVFEQSPYGNGAERPKVLRGFHSVNSLLLDIEECVDSGISDEDCSSICRDMMRKTLDVPPALFDSHNTTINKAFTVHGVGLPSNNVPQERQASQTNLSAIAQKQKALRDAATAQVAEAAQS